MSRWARDSRRDTHLLPTMEGIRLEADRYGVPWKLWGPYLAERSWGTVREDYSVDGDAWGSFTHDDARRRAYRWTEDGLLGICDEQQRLCLALALWNGRDPILKERLFGLSNPEGNHGEDVKEIYFYDDALPTSAYLRATYIYPHRPFPYAELVAVNAARSQTEPEYELLDTGVLDDEELFEVDVTYVKQDPMAVVMRVQATNRGRQAADLHLLPTAWFRNTWAWSNPPGAPPALRLESDGTVLAAHPTLGNYRLAARSTGVPIEWLFTDNETNGSGRSAFTKDAFHRLLVDGDEGAVNPARNGTKAAAHTFASVAPGGSFVMDVALVADGSLNPESLLDGVAELIALRTRETDEFYGSLAHRTMSADERRIHRQALAGALWSLKYIEFDVDRWLETDDGSAPLGRDRLRNGEWRHVRMHDVLAVPDPWEYPWFASWDLAFQAVTLGIVDPDRAKAQLLALLDDRYLHPDGQLPAYEWEFSDLNPPLQAWAALRIYRRDALVSGEPDRAFLERMLHGLMLNFGWWVNRRDARGVNVFGGGFLGLDNISLIDRSSVESTGATLEQADATGWMAFFTLGLAEMAFELAMAEPVYVELAKHFIDRFVAIGEAINQVGENGLWDPDDRFFFDRLRRPDGSVVQLRAFSVAGVVPTLAARVTDPALLEALPAFAAHLDAVSAAHPGFYGDCECFPQRNEAGQRLVSLIDQHRLLPILDRLLDAGRFLSGHGVRSLSRIHREASAPVDVDLGAGHVRVRYEPAEAETRIKGGNSNWRGPVWFPLNYLLIQALRQFGRFYGDDVKHPFPAVDGDFLTLSEIAEQLARRLISLYLPDADGVAPAVGHDPRWRSSPTLRERVLFYEYFDAETGRGLGASHQTGWTALIANLIDESHRPGRRPRSA